VWCRLDPARRIDDFGHHQTCLLGDLPGQRGGEVLTRPPPAGRDLEEPPGGFTRLVAALQEQAVTPRGFQNDPGNRRHDESLVAHRRHCDVGVPVAHPDPVGSFAHHWLLARAAAVGHRSAHQGVFGA
jgi:hypothetical protein